MKKQSTAILLVLVLLLTMAGCASASAVQRMDAAEDRIEEKLESFENKVDAKLDVAEEKLEISLRESIDSASNKVQPANRMPSSASVPEEKPEVAPVNEQLLTKEQAQKIALDHVGVTVDQVSRLRTEYEIDDRIPQFDLEFHHGDWEYEFEIHAENGQIISYDKDHKYD